MASSDGEGLVLPRREISLYVRRGPLRGQFFPTSGTHALLIGRAPSNHIVLPHRHVSANHCLLAPGEPGKDFVLVDARSRLGTYASGRKLTKGTVGVGDVITVGPFELELVETTSAQRAPYEARPSAERSARVDLLSLEDEDLVEALRPASATIMGRGRLAHVSVDDAFVSTFHCLIALHPLDDDRRPFVIDLHSENGTYVNGRSIHRKHMRLSDTLTVGRVRFTLRLHEEGWPATPEPKLEAPPPEEPARAATTLVLTPDRPLRTPREPSEEPAPEPMLSLSLEDVPATAETDASPAGPADETAESRLPETAFDSVQDLEAELAPPRELEDAASGPVSTPGSAAPKAAPAARRDEVSEVAPHPEPTVPVWDEAFEAELQEPPRDATREPLPHFEPMALPETDRPAPAAPEPLPAARWDESSGTGPPAQPPAIDWDEPSALELPEPAQKGAPEPGPPPEPTALGEVLAELAASAGPPMPRWEEAAETTRPELPPATGWDHARQPELPEAPQGAPFERPPSAEPGAFERERTTEPTPPEAASAAPWPEEADVEAPGEPEGSAWDEASEPALAEPPRESAPEAAAPDVEETGEPIAVEAMAPPRWEGAAKAAPLGEPGLPVWDESSEPEVPEPPAEHAPQALPAAAPPLPEHEELVDDTAAEVQSAGEWDEEAEAAPSPEPAVPVWDETFHPVLPEPPRDGEPEPAPPPEPPVFDRGGPVEPVAAEALPAPRWDPASAVIPMPEPAGAAWDEAPGPPLPESAPAGAPEAWLLAEPLAAAPVRTARWQEAAELPPPPEPVVPAWDALCIPDLPELSHAVALDTLPPAESPVAIQEQVAEREAPASLPAARPESRAWDAPAAPPSAPPVSWAFEPEPAALETAMPEPQPCEPAPGGDLATMPSVDWPEPMTEAQEEEESEAARLVATIATALEQMATLAASVGLADLSRTLEGLRRDQVPADPEELAAVREARSSGPGPRPDGAPTPMAVGLPAQGAAPEPPEDEPAAGHELATADRVHPAQGEEAMPAPAPTAANASRDRLLRLGKAATGVVVFLVTAAVTAVVATRQTQPCWRAEAAVEVDPLRARILGLTDEGSQLTSYEAVFNTQMAIVKSTEVLERAVSDPSVRRLPLLADAQSPVRALRSALEVEPVASTRWFSVVLRGHDPRGLAPLLNAVVASYEATVAERTGPVIDRQTRRLAARRATLQTSLGKTSAELARLQQMRAPEEKPHALTKRRAAEEKALQATLAHTRQSLLATQERLRELEDAPHGPGYVRVASRATEPTAPEPYVARRVLYLILGLVAAAALALLTVLLRILPGPPLLKAPAVARRRS